MVHCGIGELQHLQGILKVLEVFTFHLNDDFFLLSAGFLEKAGVNRTRLLASPLQPPDASCLPLERNEYECPANEYFIVTIFILLCLLKYLRMACGIREFLL